MGGSGEAGWGAVRRGVYCGEDHGSAPRTLGGHVADSLPLSGLQLPALTNSGDNNTFPLEQLGGFNEIRHAKC